MTNNKTELAVLRACAGGGARAAGATGGTAEAGGGRPSGLQ